MFVSVSTVVLILVGLQTHIFSNPHSISSSSYMAADDVKILPQSSTNFIGAAADSFIRKHHFIFVSGWPQSGTSFVQQIFNFHPMASTMIEQCDRIKGVHLLYA